MTPRAPLRPAATSHMNRPPARPRAAAGGAGAAAGGGEPDEPSPGPPQGDSVLANVPAGIAFLRASLARLRGDAALAAGYNRQALAQLGEDDWLMPFFVHWNQAAADWLG